MLSIKPIINIKNPYSNKCVLFVGTPEDISFYNDFRNDVALTSASIAAKTYNGKAHTLSYINVSKDVNDEELVDAAKVACQRDITIRYNGQMLSNNPITYGFSIYSGIYQIKPIEEVKLLAIKELISAVPLRLSRDDAIAVASEQLNIDNLEAQELVNMYKDPILSTVDDLVSLKSALNVSAIREIDFTASRVNLLRASMSLGKTTTAIEIAKKVLSSNPDAKVVYISHIEALGQCFKNKLQSQFCTKLSTCDHKEMNIGKLESASVLTTTINSLPGLLFEVLQADLIIWDECEKGITATKGSHFQNLDSQLNSYESLKSVVENAKWLIMMDADISEDISGNFVRSIGKDDIAIYNVDDYSAYKNRTVSIKDRATVLNSPFNERLYAFDCLKTMWRSIKRMGYKSNNNGCYKKALQAGILVVCSDTKRQPEVIDFISDPNVEAQKYHKIFYSPYIGCGVSIEEHYSDTITIISNSVLVPNSLVQLALRFRAVKEIHFAVSRDRNSYLLPAKPVVSDKFTFNDMVGLHEAQSTVLKANMPVALIATLEALGFESISIETSSSNKNKHKQLLAARNRVDSNEEAHAISEAQDISAQEATSIIESGNATNEEKASADKFLLAKEFGIPSVDVNVELVKFDRLFKLRDELLSLQNKELRERLTPDGKRILSVANTVIGTLGLSYNEKVVISNENYIAAYSQMKIKHNQIVLSKYNGISFRTSATVNNITQIKRSVNHFLKILGFSCKNEGKSTCRKSTVELHPFSKSYLNKHLNTAIRLNSYRSSCHSSFILNHHGF